MTVKDLILGWVLVGLIGSGCSNQLPAAAVAYAEQVVDTPTLFAEGVISTPDNSEFELTFSPNGRTVYFSRRAPDEKQAIYRSTFNEGTWTTPVRATFSTDRDEAAMITPDGQYLFFGSERPIPNQPNRGSFDMNVWKMKRTETGWGTPEPLPSPINAVQVEGEAWPSSNNNFFFTNDNQTFYYTTMKRGTASIQLYQTEWSEGAFSEPKRVEGLWDNDSLWVYAAVVSPDGNYLVFNSYGAPGGAGGEDLFVSKKTADGWSKAQPMGALINTPDEESNARFSRDGRYFFFSRAENLGNYEYGPWNIYFVETAHLQLARLHD